MNGDDLVTYPGLSSEDAEEIYNELSEYSNPEELRESGFPSTSSEKSIWRPTGIRVGDEKLAEVQEELWELAKRCGWPETPAPRSKNLQKWSGESPRIIHNAMNIVPADCYRGDVWSWLSLVLVPDLAIWRWPTKLDSQIDRITGYGPRSGTRNFLRIPWWRAEVLGAGEDDPPAVMFEDRLVSLLERPEVARNHLLGKTVAKIWIEERGEDQEFAEELFREYIMRVRRRGGTYEFSAFSEKELKGFINQEFESLLNAWPSEVPKLREKKRKKGRRE